MTYEKLLFKFNVKVDTVFCSSEFIRESTILKLTDIFLEDEFKILDLLKSLGIDHRNVNDSIFLRVDRIVSYDTGTCYLDCYVQVYQLLEVSQ